MHCCCKEKETFDIKVKADVGADPIWCNSCGCNYDIEEAPLSEDLKEELQSWIRMYGGWIDWSNDELLPDAIRLENEHNSLGQQLTEKVKQELGVIYKIRFSPSTSARMYSDLDL
ncbi:hypothetical protein [Bacillus massilinigeriensis]|uniref:hypothetical protein n=1 Tax=Bacillus mediterraneensis TaxID=1805474 RepID=UPI0008F85BFF|nr:hypothetical protein [Bacillus mediterraneensis]